MAKSLWDGGEIVDLPAATARQVVQKAGNDDPWSGGEVVDTPETTYETYRKLSPRGRKQLMDTQNAFATMAAQATFEASNAEPQPATPVVEAPKGPLARALDEAVLQGEAYAPSTPEKSGWINRGLQAVPDILTKQYAGMEHGAEVLGAGATERGGYDPAFGEVDLESRKPSKEALKVYKAAEDRIAKLRPTDEEGKVAQYGFDIVSNVGAQVPNLLAAGALGANPSLAMMGAGAAADKFAELESSGVAAPKALAGALIVGTGEALTEKLGLEALLKQGLPLVKRMVLHAGFDVPGEVVQMVNENTVDWILKTPDAKPADLWKKVKDDFIPTAITAFGSAMVLGGGSHLAHKIIEEKQKKEGSQAPAEKAVEAPKTIPIEVLQEKMPQTQAELDELIAEYGAGRESATEELAPEKQGDKLTESAVSPDKLTDSEKSTDKLIRTSEEEKPAGIKMMITKADETALRDLGYSDADINRMKPEEAGAILEAKTSKRPEKPASPEAQEAPKPDEAISQVGAETAPIAEKPEDEQSAPSQTQEVANGNKAEAQAPERLLSDQPGQVETPAPVEPASEKQPWQMTKSEFLALPRDRSDKHGSSDAFMSGRHHGSVEHAIKKGLPVSPEVLADYPDLAPKADAQYSQKDGADSETPRRFTVVPEPLSKKDAKFFGIDAHYIVKDNENPTVLYPKFSDKGQAENFADSLESNPPPSQQAVTAPQSGARPAKKPLPNIRQFFIDSGGINLKAEERGGYSGELRLLKEEMTQPEYNRLIRVAKIGTSIKLDDALSKAKEYGYLPKDATADDLIEAIKAKKPHPVVAEDAQGKKLQGFDQRTDTGKREKLQFITDSELARKEMHDHLIDAGIKPESPIYDRIMGTFRKAERKPDRVTGWESREDFNSIAERMWAESTSGYNPATGTGGRDVSYASIDLVNMGGLNKYLKSESAADSDFIRPTADMIRQTLEEAGIDNAVYIRKGGDELSIFAPDTEQETLAKALESAKMKVWQRSKEKGVDALAHGKTQQPNVGFGIYYGTSQINHSFDLTDAIEDAEKALYKQKEELEKGERNAGGEIISREARSDSPSEQAGRVEEGADSEARGTGKEKSGSEGRDSQEGDNQRTFLTAPEAPATTKPKAAQSDMFGAKTGLEGPISADSVDLTKDNLFTRDETVKAEQAKKEDEKKQTSLMDAETPADKIDDFGEKIGGSRKDTAERGFTKSQKSHQEDSAEPWRKKYIAMQKVDGSGWTIAKAGDSSLLSMRRDQNFATQEEAEAAIPLIAVAEKHRTYQNNDKTWSIFKRVTDRKMLKVVNQDFPSREEAMKHMATHAEEILNLKTNFGEEILPVPEIAKRTGAERRTGPATPEMFMETFAPRGIEFGNWNNQEERQQVLNHAYDGLLDLAEALNVPPKALMLNGDLAIAFGARGQGLQGAKAHYERDYGVINLTKMSGAGSLAHEWFHALDHYLARLDSKSPSEKIVNKRGDSVYKATSRLHDYQSHGPSVKSKMRTELKDAYSELVKGMFHKAEQYVEDTKRADDFLKTGRDNLKERLDGIRRDLTRDITSYKKRGGSPASAEQLAEFDRLADILLEGGNLETAFRYNDEEKAKTAKEKKMSLSQFGRAISGRFTNDTLEAMNAILKAVRNRSGFNSEKTGWLDSVRNAMNTYAQRLKMFEDAKAGTEKTKKVPTTYAIEARKMDQARVGDYWSEPHEMAARAFAAYVEDKIAAQGNQSEFLVYHAHGGILLPMIDGFVARPYPEGKERESIGKAFDKFIGAIQTKETDKGVAMFKRNAESVLVPLDAVKLDSVVKRITVNWKGGAERITVVDTFDALPAAIQEEAAKQGAKPDEIPGVFHHGKVYLVRQNIASEADAEGVIFHEAYGHAGLRGLLGPRIKDKFLQLHNAIGAKTMRDIAEKNGIPLDLYEEGFRQAGHSLGTRRAMLTDELLAHLQKTYTKGGIAVKIKEAIGAVRNWMRQKGFAELAKWNDADIAHLLKQSREYIRSGGRVDGKGTSFMRVDGEKRTWASRLARAIGSKDGSPLMIVIQKTPSLYLGLGANDHPIAITKEMRDKLAEEKKHDGIGEIFYNLPNELNEPALVLQGAEKNAFVIVPDKLIDGAPVVIAMHLDAQIQHYVVNKIASIYAKSGDHNWLNREIINGKLLYVNKKAFGAIRAGITLTEEASQRLSDFNISSANDNVKRLDIDAIRDTAQSRAINRVIAKERGHATEYRFRILPKVRNILKAVEANKIDEFMAVDQMQSVYAEMEARAAEKRLTNRERQRGADIIREKILAAKRRGEITHEHADFIEWFALKNEALLDGLGVSVKQGEPGAAGQYNVAGRIINIFKGTEKNTTGVHEILHHFERMMPTEMQRGVRKAWSAAVMAEIKTEESALKKVKTENTFDALKEVARIEGRLRFLNAVLMAEYGGGAKMLQHIGDKFKNGELSQGDYKYFSPSEYWAVTMTNRAVVQYKGSWWEKTRQWFKEAWAHTKAALGLKGDSALYRAMESIASGDGTFQSKKMLGNDTALFDVEGENKDTETTAYSKITDPSMIQKIREWNKKYSLGIRNEDLGAYEAIYNIPNWIAQDHPEFMQFKHIEENRQEQRETYLHEMLQSPTKKRAGEHHEFLSLNKEDEAVVSKLIVESDADNRLISKKELEERGITEPQMIAYYSWKRSMDKALEARIENYKKVSLIPYEDRPYFDQLKQVMDLDETEAQQKTLELAEQMSPEQAEMFLKDVDRLTPEKGSLKELRAEIGKMNFYMPRTRGMGEYVARVYDEDDKGNRFVVWSERTTSQREGKMKIEPRLQKEFPGMEIIWRHEPHTPEFMYQEMSDAAIERFIDKSIEKVREGKKVSESDLAEVRAAIKQTLVDDLKSRGFGKHSIKRKKGDPVGGYKTEGLKDVFISYMSGAAGYMSKSEAAMRHHLALANMPQNKPRLMEYTQRYVKDLLRNQTKVDRVSGRLRGMAYTWYLMGNIRFAAIQITQNYVTAMPELAKHTSGAHRKYHAAMVQVTTGAGITAEESAILEKAYNGGIIRDQYMKEVMAKTQAGPKRAWQKALDLLSAPFTKMESFNRKAAFLAAYRVAKNEKKMDEKAAYDFARQFVDNTHYWMGKANLPQWARGEGAGASMARTAYTFRSFQHNYMLWLRQSVKQGPQGYKAIALSMSWLAAFGGAAALPFLDDLLDLLERMTGYPARKIVKDRLKSSGGNALARMGTQGIPALIGVDLSGSLKMEVPFMKAISGTGGASDVYGVYSGLGSKLTKGVEFATERQIYLAAESLAPVFIENMLKAKRMTNKPFLDSHGHIVIDKATEEPQQLTTREGIGKALGFQPSRISEQSKDQRIVQNVVAKYASKRKSLIDEYRFAENQEDEAAKDRIETKVEKFNDEIEKYAEGIAPITDRTLNGSLNQKVNKRTKKLMEMNMAE